MDYYNETYFNAPPSLGCCCQQNLPALGNVVQPGIAFNTQPDTPTKWGCADWMFWHQQLVKAFMEGKFASRINYPRSEAIRLSNQVFMEWWKKQVSFWDSRYWCAYNTDFFNYFKSVGLTDHMSFIAGIVTPLIGGATEVSANTAQTAANITETTSKTSNTLKYVLPILLVAAAAGTGYYVYKNYIKGNKRVKVKGVEV